MQKITLYHGSRNGITGNIKPESREKCDFGKGFYMGTNPMQAKTLIYNETTPMFYTLDFHLENIPEDKILTLSDINWAFYILYNRGRLESINTTSFYKRIAQMDTGKDVIIGPIADDKMGMVMREFARNTITDKGMLECIRCINYGIQYVAKTENACNQIEVKSKEPLNMDEYEEYQKFTDERREESEQKVNAIREQYLREGKFLKEILEEEQKKEK